MWDGLESRKSVDLQEFVCSFQVGEIGEVV